MEHIGYLANGAAGGKDFFSNVRQEILCIKDGLLDILCVFENQQFLLKLFLLSLGKIGTLQLFVLKLNKVEGFAVLLGFLLQLLQLA